MEHRWPPVVIVTDYPKFPAPMVTGIPHVITDGFRWCASTGYHDTTACLPLETKQIREMSHSAEKKPKGRPFTLIRFCRLRLKSKKPKGDPLE